MRYFSATFKRRVLYFLLISAVVGIIYYPSLRHLPRADHLFYLADMAGKNDWWTLAVKSYDFSRSRTFAKGDDLFFRPGAIFVLGTEKALFGYRFWLWQLTGIALHLFVVWQLLKILLHIRDSPFAFFSALFFSVLYINSDTVIWHHINSIMLGLGLVLSSVFQFYRYVVDRERQTWRCLVIFAGMLVACFTYEVFCAYAGLMFLGFLFANRKERGCWPLSLFILAPVLLYVSLNALHFVMSGTEIMEKGIFSFRAGPLVTVKNTGLALLWWFSQGLFPTRYTIGFRYGRAGIVDLEYLNKILTAMDGPIVLGIFLVLMMIVVLVHRIDGKEWKRRIIFFGLIVGYILSWAGLLAIYRINYRGVPFALAGTLSYAYIFWSLLVILVYAVVMSGTWRGRGQRTAGWLCAGLLLGMSVLNGLQVFRLNVRLAEADATGLELVKTLNRVIRDNEADQNFSFYIAPDYPGNYAVPNRLRYSDPPFKRYSFIEMLYLDTFDEFTPRLLLLPSTEGPQVMRGPGWSKSREAMAGE